MSETDVDALWKEPFGKFATRQVNVYNELEMPQGSLQELLTQMRLSIAKEPSDSGALKQLGFYLDFACQILRLDTIRLHEQKCVRIMKFMDDCRALLNDALGRQLVDAHWQDLSHYVENQTCRLKGKFGRLNS